jgi:hypothetical protein
VNVELDGKHWGVTYDVAKKVRRQAVLSSRLHCGKSSFLSGCVQDLELKGEWKIKNGEFKIKQKVPGLKTELLPSPEVQVSIQRRESVTPTARLGVTSRYDLDASSLI